MVTSTKTQRKLVPSILWSLCSHVLFLQNPFGLHCCVLQDAERVAADRVPERCLRAVPRRHVQRVRYVSEMYRFLNCRAFQKLLVLERCRDSFAVETEFKNQLLEQSAVQEQISGMVGGSSTRLGSKK